MEAVVESSNSVRVLCNVGWECRNLSNGDHSLRAWEDLSGGDWLLKDTWTTCLIERALADDPRTYTIKEVR